GMKLGDEFKSSHGLIDDEDLAHDDSPSFIVIGILKPTGSVIDQLILTTTQTYWSVHEEHDHEGEEHSDEEHEHAEGEHEHEHEDHGEHDHDKHDDHDHDGDGTPDHAAEDHVNTPKSLLEEDDEKSITSLLLKFKGRNFQALNMQRGINENTDMQAATPAIEVNRLYSLMNTGEQALTILAYVIIFVSGLSIFISLFSSLKERKYELALMRVMGAKPAKLFGLIVLEGLLLAIIGFAIGILLSHGGMQIFASAMKDAYRYTFSGWEFLPQELYLLGGTLLIGFLAAVIPAIQAANTDISETLTR
ncbi:MAG: FtsX-like permease family protein, partial [Bacteroidota bacterium]